MSLIVLESGLHSLLVGESCWDLRPVGVPAGGPADPGACRLGNALVGNKQAIALEVILRGPTLRAEKSIACVVFGTPFPLTVNGIPVPANRTFTLKPDDLLKIRGTSVGCRAYLCVAGGFQNRLTMEPIQSNDRLICRASSVGLRSYAGDPTPTSLPEEPVVIRTLDGPQRDWFPEDTLWRQTYTVSNASNRMGVRLEGEAIFKRAGELASEPVSPGSVQVANDGMPVILGVDGQTIGGYPRIAHVIRADLDLVGQLRPGGRVRFAQVSAAEAKSAHQTRQARLRQLADRAIWSFAER